MPANYKVLGQSAPASNTLTSLYTVPASTQACCSTIAICNLGVSCTYRVAVRPAGAAISNQHYLVWDASVNAADSVLLTLGISLAATDVVSVQASGTVAFSLFGSEIT
jgi:hypothetical protein